MYFNPSLLSQTSPFVVSGSKVQRYWYFTYRTMSVEFHRGELARLLKLSWHLVLLCDHSRYQPWLQWLPGTRRHAEKAVRGVKDYIGDVRAVCARRILCRAALVRMYRCGLEEEHNRKMRELVPRSWSDTQGYVLNSGPLPQALIWCNTRAVWCIMESWLW